MYSEYAVAFIKIQFVNYELMGRIMQKVWGMRGESSGSVSSSVEGTSMPGVGRACEMRTATAAAALSHWKLHQAHTRRLLSVVPGLSSSHL
jgi:hypothetical protein